MIETEKNHSTIRELWKVSWPLMLSFFSSMCMIFVDRLYLAWYDSSVLSAAVSAGTITWGFTYGFQVLTMVAAVFIAQYNGAGKYSKIGEPIWQMLWLITFSFAIFLPIGLFAGPLLFGESPIRSLQIEYFRYIMCFGPLLCYHAPLLCFFTGRGKSTTVTWITIIGNVINVILDPIFIFGIEGWVPSMGMFGACLATAIGAFSEALIALPLVLRKCHRVRYRTDSWHFKWRSCLKCIRIGGPEAFAVGFEIAAWGFFYCLMSQLSMEHIFVTGLAQTIIILFFFFNLGLEQGGSVLAGNLIGANREHEVNHVFFAGVKIICLGMVALAVLFFFGQDLMIGIFFSHTEYQEGTEKIQSMSPEQLEHAKYLVKQGLVFIWAYLGFESIRFLTNGILRAAGDTFFILISGVCCIWFFMLAPTYLLTWLYDMPIIVTHIIWVFFSFSAMLISYTRFSKGRWKEIQLIEG